MPVRPVYRTATVLEVNPAGPRYVDLLLRESDIARSARPGQFLMIRAWPGGDPFLPRPFDIMSCDAVSQTVRIFIKVEGRGTLLLQSLEPGSRVEVTGPLGQPIEDYQCSSVAFLVRGAGAAAVVLLAQVCRQRGIDVFCVLSASTAPLLVCRQYLEPVCTEMLVATDDGSEGYGGLATELIDDLLSRRSIDRIYTCGSRRFARYVQGLDRQGSCAGYVFLEGLMACGMGDCHGCAVARSDEPGYYLVCRDGPHFRAGEVKL